MNSLSSRFVIGNFLTASASLSSLSEAAILIAGKQWHMIHHARALLVLAFMQFIRNASKNAFALALYLCLTHDQSLKGAGTFWS